MIKGYFPIISLVAIAVSLVPCIVGWYCYNRLGKELRILLLYSAIEAVASLIGMVLAFNGINNHWLGHVYTPIRFGLLMWILSLWQTDARMKKAFIITLGLYIVFFFTGLMHFESILQFNSVTGPVSCLLLVFGSLITLIGVVAKAETPWFRNPGVWVSLGAMIYFGGISILYAMFNQLLTVSLETLRAIWAPVNSSLNILFYVTVTSAFFTSRWNKSSNNETV